MHIKIEIERVKVKRFERTGGQSIDVNRTFITNHTGVILYYKK